MYNYIYVQLLVYRHCKEIFPRIIPKYSLFDFAVLIPIFNEVLFTAWQTAAVAQW